MCVPSFKPCMSSTLALKLRRRREVLCERGLHAGRGRSGGVSLPHHGRVRRLHGRCVPGLRFLKSTSSVVVRVCGWNTQHVNRSRCLTALNHGMRPALNPNNRYCAGSQGRWALSLILPLRPALHGAAWRPHALEPPRLRMEFERCD